MRSTEQVKTFANSVRSAGASGARTLQNPVVRKRADPWMYQEGDLYHFVYSDNHSICVNTVRSIDELRADEPKYKWTPPAGTHYSYQVWAPELFKIDGRYYIYFAASDGRNVNHRMFVLEADNACGPYRFKGQISPETDTWAIDGTVFEKAPGERYFIWSGWDGKANTQQNLYIARMENPWTLKKRNGAVQVLSVEQAKLNNAALTKLPGRVKAIALAEHSESSAAYTFSVKTAGQYVLDIHYCNQSLTKSTHQVELNGEAHGSLVYSATGVGNWQTAHIFVELKAGVNQLKLSHGISECFLGTIEVKEREADRTVISVPEYEWEKRGGPPYVNEGPTILRRNEAIHVIYSASGSWSDDYQLGQLTLTGADPLDPRCWTKKNKSVFAKTDKIFGPGHASFITMGGQDWIIYHAAKAQGSGWRRNTHMQPFTWDDRDSPVFGEPVAPGEDILIDAEPSSSMTERVGA